MDKLINCFHLKYPKAIAKTPTNPMPIIIEQNIFITNNRRLLLI